VNFYQNAQGKWEGRFQWKGSRKKQLLLYYNGMVEPKNKAEARECCERFCGAVRRGETYLPPTVDKNLTVEQFVEYYRRTYWAEKVRTGYGDISVMKVVARHFAGEPISVFAHAATWTMFKSWLATTPIEAYRRCRNKPTWVTLPNKLRSAKTISYYIKRIKHMVEIAYADDFITANPFLKKPHLMGGIVQSEPRRRGVTVEEEKALYAALDLSSPAQRALKERMDVTFELGLRRQEMQYLQLEDIDFDKWTMTIHQYKMLDGKKVHTGKTKTRTIPIESAKLRTLFLKKREQFSFTTKGKAFVFGLDGEYTAVFTGTFDRLKQRANLDDATLRKQGKMTLHWHDIRGEAGTRLRRSGADPATIAKILGHSRAMFLEVYESDTIDLMRAAFRGTK
jgi:integrase